MSFAELEVSEDRGEPITLYLFRYGSPAGAVVAYTDGERERDFDDETTGLISYKPVAIDRDEITASGDLSKSTIEIRTSDDAELADLFRLYPPSQVVTLTIFHGHANDQDEQFLVEWSGRVVAFNTEDNQAIYTCEPVSTSMKRPGLRRRWQYGCPHVLYGQGPRKCNANKAAATETHVVMNVAGAVLTFDSAWSNRKAKFHGGLAEWTLPSGIREVRTILRCDADGIVILSGYAAGLEPGSGVDLVLGCNHKMGVGPQPDGDCLPLHNNIRNFGGQGWIPTKNPVGLVNNYW